jgi:hypothetical protein
MIAAYFRYNNPRQNIRGHINGTSEEMLSPNTLGSVQKSAINILSSNSEGMGEGDSQTDGVASSSGSCRKETPALSLEILSFAPQGKGDLLHLFDEEGAGSDSDSDPQPVVKKIRRTNYDHTRKFQLEWHAKMPWAEGSLLPDGSLYLVRYRSCSTMDGREKVMAPKWNILCKHKGYRCVCRQRPADEMSKER